MNIEQKWRWKMNWCKALGVAPANNYFWDMAESAFKAFINAKSKESHMKNIKNIMRMY